MENLTDCSHCQQAREFYSFVPDLSDMPTLAEIRTCENYHVKMIEHLIRHDVQLSILPAETIRSLHIFLVNCCRLAVDQGASFEAKIRDGYNVFVTLSSSFFLLDNQNCQTLVDVVNIATAFYAASPKTQNAVDCKLAFEFCFSS